MKYFATSVAICSLILIAFSCRKTSFINDQDALISFSADTLHFDTVFTSTGSVTQSFKIFNQNDQKLRISKLQLKGGPSSPFKINLDGSPGTDFSDLELEPNDSAYVFVSVTINPGSGKLPFIVSDSIQINYNGNDKYVQLQAFGQNANFYRNRRITSDSVWNNDLPFVILDGLSVDSNVTLTINKGCRIYSHANAPFIVNGSLKVEGEAQDSSRVIFSGDRLDLGYNELPGAWPGIHFTQSSVNNVINYAIIKNAYQGILTESAISANPKITLSQCIIDNIYDVGIGSLGSSIKAVNCLISNCGSNISIGAGGNYSFDHCTVVSYANVYIDHKNPVFFVSNAYGENQTFPLAAHFSNCIFYGEGSIVKDEVIVDKEPSSDPFQVTFKNVLYKNQSAISDPLFTESIKNELPQFDSIDVVKNIYDFHLKPTSPAVDKGVRTSVTIDLDGKARRISNLPDLGCYEE